jgi:hypothetical protein
VADAPQVPGGWDPAESGDPPAQLLRRAISHVESLLHRLENPTDATREPSADAAPPPDASRGEPQDLSDRAPVTPISPTVAEAQELHSTLQVYEEEQRAEAAASAARADAAAEGERILTQAREVSDRVQTAARQSASELLVAAQHESAALLAAAEAEADHIRAVTARRAREDVADAVVGVRETLVRLVDQLRDSLASFDASLATVDDPSALRRPPPPRECESLGLRRVPVEEPARGASRRPLGLLFGAPRP